jgi:hypothetical protein
MPQNLRRIRLELWIRESSPDRCLHRGLLGRLDAWRNRISETAGSPRRGSPPAVRCPAKGHIGQRLSVGDVPTRDYIFNRILPRPRDLLFLTNTAINNAVNAGHDQVLEADIRSAERTYSRFAFEAAIVANGITSGKLEELLFEFAGSSALLTDEDIANALNRVGVPIDVQEDVIAHMLSLEFIGREIGEGRFTYGSEGPDAKLANVLARKTAEAHGGMRRYRVHPAFCPYLELNEDT